MLWFLALSTICSHFNCFVKQCNIHIITPTYRQSLTFLTIMRCVYLSAGNGNIQITRRGSLNELRFKVELLYKVCALCRKDYIMKMQSKSTLHALQTIYLAYTHFPTASISRLH